MPGTHFSTGSTGGPLLPVPEADLKLVTRKLPIQTKLSSENWVYYLISRYSLVWSYHSYSEIFYVIKNSKTY